MKALYFGFNIHNTMLTKYPENIRFMKVVYGKNETNLEWPCLVGSRAKNSNILTANYGVKQSQFIKLTLKPLR